MTRITVEPRYNEEQLKARQNFSKIYGNKPRYKEPRYNEIPAITNWFWRSQRKIYLLSLTVSKNDMMIQMIEKRNAALIGQDGETLTFKAWLYLNVAVDVQVCRLFCVV